MKGTFIASHVVHTHLLEKSFALKAAPDHPDIENELHDANVSTTRQG